MNRGKAQKGSRIMSNAVGWCPRPTKEKEKLGIPAIKQACQAIALGSQKKRSYERVEYDSKLRY